MPEAFTRYGDEVAFLAGPDEENKTVWAFSPPDHLRALHGPTEMWAPPSGPVMAVLDRDLYFNKNTRLMRHTGSNVEFVHDFQDPEGTSFLNGLRTAGDRLTISVSRASTHELWAYDGSAPPERLVDDHWAICAEGDAVYFSTSTALDPDVPEHQIWSYSGGEPVLFATVQGRNLGPDCVVLGGAIYVNLAGELWRVDATSAEPITPGKRADWLVNLPGERAYFESHDWGPRETWSVGIAGDLRPEPELPGVPFAVYGGRVLSGDAENVYVIDGDEITVLSNWPSSGSAGNQENSVEQPYAVIDDTLIFAGGTLEFGAEPYTWDGHGAPRLLRDIYPGCKCVAEEIE
jgi:hypothetical protein